MKRKSFLITTGAFMAGVIFPLPTAQGADRSNQPAKSIIPESELLGRKRPVLFGKGFNLRKEAAEAFDAMRAAAKKDGITIYSQSSYRGYEHQRKIWNRKYTSFSKKKKTPAVIIDEIIRYSAIPGTSRHHWGTDLDMVDHAVSQPDSLLEARNYHKGGVFHKLYNWLRKNAGQYGFYEVYTSDPKRTGFAEEPWHWSYKTTSIPLLDQFYSLPIDRLLNDTQLRGSKHFTPSFWRRYKRDWVLGINPVLIPQSLREPVPAQDTNAGASE